MNVTQKAWGIRMEGLSAGYGDRLVLDDFSAFLPAGKISVILGESGCGKTTLLRVLLGLMPARAGALHVGDAELFTLSPAKFRALRRRFGVLFQDGALLGSLTLEENVGLPLREHTRLSAKTIREAVMNTLALVGLADAAKRYPGELSGGMKKRAGLARAIIIEPPLLFCDEPTSGLDPLTSARMNRLLLDMNRQYPQMTTVVITHDMGSVRRIAAHALMLREGKAFFNGSAEELFASQDPYIQDFVSQTTPMPAPRQTTARTAAQTLEDETVPPPLMPPANPEVRAALDEWLNG